MSAKKYLNLEGLSKFFEKLINIFAEKIHSHTVSDISDYVVDSELSSTSTNPIENKIVKAEFDSVNTMLETKQGKQMVVTATNNVASHSPAEILDWVNAGNSVVFKDNTIHQYLEGASTVSCFYSNYYDANKVAYTIIIIDKNKNVAYDRGEIDYATQEELDTQVEAITAEVETLSSNAVLKIPQELTSEECDQVRTNIHSIGKNVEGFEVYHFTPIETEDDMVFEKTLDETPTIAKTGAEIYNDYENNLATGYYSVAEGFGTQAIGDFSHAEGWLTRAGGYCAIATGRRSQATGAYSHAEGMNATASSNCAHAEGEGSQATGARSHAEGYFTTAKHNQAHSEGMNTVASGLNSHAEGWGTTASGQNSFSGGKNTVASGTNSSAHGLGTIASGAQQVVHGKYNVSDKTSLMIVGNGTSDTARKNVYTLNQSGDGWYAGDVIADGNGEPVSLKNINTLLGSETLSTETKTIIGAINELYTLYTSFIEITNSEVDSIVT